MKTMKFKVINAKFIEFPIRRRIAGGKQFITNK